MSKIKIYEVDPDHQGEFLTMHFITDCFPEASFFGNWYYRDHKTPLYLACESFLIDGIGEAESIGNDFCMDDAIGDVEDWFKNRDLPIDRETASAIYNGAITDNLSAVDLMNIVQKEKYIHMILSGCCQSDWIECVMPATYDCSIVEGYFFNTGTEYSVELSPSESVYGNYYCGTHEENIRQICKEYDVDISDVVFYQFDGYTKKAKYQIVNF